MLIMAGGTGGHVMPALAVAQYFQQAGFEVHWLGTETGIEAKLVPSANIPLHIINISGLRGKGFSVYLFAPFKILKAIFQALKHILAIKPSLVLSMGGYASGPGGIAAWLCRIPLMLHEQNAIFGLTNKILAKFAKKIMTAFPFQEHNKSKHKKFLLTGNPVRDNICNLAPPMQRLQNKSSSAMNLLVLGGSQGATAINELVPKAIMFLNPKQRPNIWHQTGKNTLNVTRAKYMDYQISAQVDDFIQDMSKAYAWADLVIARAGALTISELAASGICSILIPFPFAVDDHQTKNALYLSEANAAVLLSQSDITAETLSEKIAFFIENPELRLEMAQNARSLAKPHAAKNVVTTCIEVCSG